MPGIEQTIWRSLRRMPLRLGLVGLLILTLLGCKAGPPVSLPAATAPPVASSPNQTSEAAAQANPSVDPAIPPDNLPIVDVVEFGINPQLNFSTQSFRVKGIASFAPGTQRARIKVRQVSDLGNSYLTFVSIQNTAQGTTTLHRAWQGYGSYDIIWDGRDDQGNLIASGDYEIVLHKPANGYRTKGFHIKQTIPWPAVRAGVPVCAALNLSAPACAAALTLGILLFKALIDSGAITKITSDLLRAQEELGWIQVYATDSAGVAFKNLTFQITIVDIQVRGIPILNPIITGVTNPAGYYEKAVFPGFYSLEILRFKLPNDIPLRSGVFRVWPGLPTRVRIQINHFTQDQAGAMVGEGLIQVIPPN